VAVRQRSRYSPAGTDIIAGSPSGTPASFLDTLFTRKIKDIADPSRFTGANFLAPLQINPGLSVDMGEQCDWHGLEIASASYQPGLYRFASVPAMDCYLGTDAGLAWRKAGPKTVR
jgi:hypothetical protein